MAPVSMPIVGSHGHGFAAIPVANGVVIVATSASVVVSPVAAVVVMVAAGPLM